VLASPNQTARAQPSRMPMVPRTHALACPGAGCGIGTGKTFPEELTVVG